MAHLRSQHVGGELHHHAMFDSGEHVIGFGDEALSEILERTNDCDRYEVVEAIRCFAKAKPSDEIVLAFDFDLKDCGAGIRNVVLSEPEGSAFIGSFFCLLEGGINQRVANDIVS